MSKAELTRSEMIKRALLRKAFLDAALPDEQQTLLDFRRLFALARERAAEYRSAAPFPHIVIDDFLPESSLKSVLDSMPALDDPGVQWGNLNANLSDGRPAQAKKYHLQNVLQMKPAVRELIAELNSGPFTFVLSQLAGIDDLIIDAQLLGGGVHIVQPGGLLRVHADFRRHVSYNLERRLNLLLYLNPGWREEYGGHLELWDPKLEHCVQRVLPIANRCVIFNTGKDSFHGHPRPLTCPDGVNRRSIALYYYSADRPTETSENHHATDWQELPDERG
jgi:Rps23 Pro-64 3,4-dihydroxylase Tpa1-like proline 4-hydroxylase